MITQINDCGNNFDLFIEVENIYSEYLTYEIADYIVYLLIPVALKRGVNIYSDIPVTDIFLHNISEILIPHLILGDSSLHKITVKAPLVNFTTRGGGNWDLCFLRYRFNVHSYVICK